MAKQQTPVFSTKERTRIDGDYYMSDASEVQTYSQDSEFVRSLIEAHRF